MWPSTLYDKAFLKEGRASFISIRYENKVKTELNTYDSILLKCNSVPNMDGRNIIKVETIDDIGSINDYLNNLKTLIINDLI